MRRLLPPQSELSAASAIFYFAGALLAALTVSVLRPPDQPPSYLNLATAIGALFVAVGFLAAGRRARTVPALAMLTVTSIMVLYLSAIAINELRMLNSGALYFTFLFYLSWFGPIWYARLFGLLWLSAFWIIAIVRFGPDMALTLVTVTMTSTLLNELVALYRRRLAAMSLTDGLCAVWNNRGIRERLEQLSRAARRDSRPLTVVYLDLDGFKGINDRLGHAGGDRVLQEFAAQVAASTRPQDELGRLGGDEFMLVMPGTDGEGAQRAMERLRAEVDVCGWSFGVSELVPGDDLDDLIMRADERMYREKQRRGGAGQQAH